MRPQRGGATSAAAAVRACVCMCACVAVAHGAAKADASSDAKKSTESLSEHAWYVPVSVLPPAASADGARPTDVRALRVSMCAIDWALYRADPTATPMFRDLSQLSRCAFGGAHAGTFTTTFGALEDEYIRRGCDLAPGPGCAPSGIITHMSRCGSTLTANMLASLPDTLVYSESSTPAVPFFDYPTSPSEAVRMLRVLGAAMGRPIAAHALGYPPPRLGESASRKPASTTWAPRHMYWKLQSSLVPFLYLFRRAFPDVPWTFVHRDGVEVLASLLKNAKVVPAPDAAVDEHVAVTDMGIRMAPCMRLRGETTPTYVRAVTGALSTMDVLALPSEDYCAATVSELLAVALHQASEARRDALRALGIASTAAGEGFIDGVAAARIASEHADVLATRDGMLLNATSLRGAIAGVGQGLMLPYTALPAGFLDVFAHHLRPNVPDYVFGEAERQRMLEVSGKYSKARGRVATRGGDLARNQPSINEAGGFVEDSEDKQALAWPSLKAAAARLLTPLLAVIERFNVAVEGAANTSPFAGVALDATLSPVIARALPIGGGYPHHYPLIDMLSAWNPDIVTLPKSYGRYQSLRIFDYQDASDRQEAEMYRRSEVPFVIRNIPAVHTTVATWASDEHLLKIMGKDERYIADVSDSNHFMYFHKTAARRDRSFKEPTWEEALTMPQWLAAAYQTADAVFAEESEQIPHEWRARADVQVPASVLNNATLNGDAVLRKLFPLSSRTRGRVLSREFWTPERVSQLRSGLEEAGVATPDPIPGVPPAVRANRTLYYLRASTNPRIPIENTWIADEWPLFDKSKASFFMVDPAQQKGIHCRYGMPGIIAESHYDSGRNFIIMTRGRKRYIMAGPEQCQAMSILKDGPSSRHSSVDWSDPAQWAALSAAKGFEVVLEAGDALYVPSFWFHFIVSLTVNIQCNSRSGTPPMGLDGIANCGFEVRVTEKIGDRTSAEPPVHHAHAIAVGALAHSSRALRDVALPGDQMVSVARAVAMYDKDIGEPMYAIALRARQGLQILPPGPKRILDTPVLPPESALRGDIPTAWILAVALIALACCLMLLAVVGRSFGVRTWLRYGTTASKATSRAADEPSPEVRDQGVESTAVSVSTSAVRRKTER